MSQVFDDKELLERVDNDWDFLAETVEMLSTDGPGLLDAIRQSIASGDAAAVSRAAHTLKGLVANFCSPDAQASAFDLERAGRAGDLSAAPAAVDELHARFDALVAALNAFLAARP